MKKNLLSLGLWLLFLPALPSQGQTPEVDSLRRALAAAPADTQRVNLLCDLSNAYRNLQTDSALAFAHRARQLAEKLDFRRGIPRAQYMLSAACYITGKLDSAAHYIQACIERLEAAADTERLIDAYNLQGVVLDQQSREVEALEALHKSLDLARRLGIKNRISTAYVSIGNIYYQQKNHDRALYNYRRAEPLLIEADDRYTLGILYNNMSSMMEVQASDSIVIYLQKALDLFEAGGYADGVAFVNNNLGDYYEEREQWAPALRHYRAALAIWEESGYPYGIANTNSAIATILAHQQRYEEAIPYFERGLAIARELGEQELLFRIYDAYAMASAGQGRHRQAYEYQLLANSARDSLYRAEINQQLAEQEAGYEARLHQEEIHRLQETAERRRRLNQIILGTSLALILLLAFGLWQFLRVRRHKELVALEAARVAKLQRLDELKDQFLANISHELRTPLNGIIGLAESLRDGAAGPLPAKAGADLGMLAASGRRLASLVNDILDFAKLKNRDLTLQRRPVDIHAAADVVLTLSRPLIGKKDIQLINAIPPDIPLVDADENRLQQILHNLVGNAVKFTEKGYVKVGSGKSEVGSRKSEVGNASVPAGEEQSPEDEGGTAAEPLQAPSTTFFHFYVEDTGIGIPPERQAGIFRAFEQADGSIARTFGGTGLGLTITRQLVELHGGTITVHSAEGKGSVFTFTLPLSAAAPDAPPPETGEVIRPLEADPDVAVTEETPAVASAAALTPDPVRILIVDDEPVNLQVLNNHLSLQGYQVVQAASGEQALDILEEDRKFDLLILDIMMPRMSGYEVCARLREMFLPSELPVVMLTARNRIGDLVEGFNAGANDYLTKPFSRDELLSRIKTHLRLHRINRATGKFVPYEFLRAIGRETITEARLGDMTERKVTMIFTDIRDYTTLSERMTPEENFRFVNAYHHRMGPVIRARGGFVNQYLGDAIMAIFPERPAEALRAAIDMQHQLRDYNQRRTAKGLQPLRVGMGLHTGPLIMGIIGDEERLDAATIADTVNTASRVEDLTKYFGVNILLTEDTLEEIRGEAGSRQPASPRPKLRRLKEVGKQGSFRPPAVDFHTRYLGPVIVKGKATPVGLYECFDGDPPESFDLKMETLADFEEGLVLYLSRAFARAASAFQRVLDVNPHDGAARLFLNKAAHYIATGVPDDWTGVEVMERK